MALHFYASVIVIVLLFKSIIISGTFEYIQGRRNEFFLGVAQKKFPFFLPKSLKPSSKSLKFGEAAASPVPQPLYITIKVA